MKKNFKELKKDILCIICIMIGFILSYSYGYSNGKKNIMPNIIYIDNMVDIKHQAFLDKSPKEGLKEALDYYNIEHADIVYAQAVLETGNFKSTNCIKYNNLFGLYNSKKKEYFKYSHWSQSVEAYRKYIQSKYKSGNYYDFLANLGYAEDSTYIYKVKEIVANNE